MKINNKENGVKAIEEIEGILKKEIREIEEETGESYEVTIGNDKGTDITMCINLDDYFKGDCYMSQIPMDIDWRDAKEIKEELKNIKRIINDKYGEHIEMLKDLKAE